jgi:hypothetical protein
LSYKEFNTVKYVAGQLRSFGLEPTEGIATTGLVVEVKGKNPQKKTIALRADMDALPILEGNNVPYKSTNEGVMHACGHDVHTSSLLGTAHILQEIKDEFEGTVRFLFQPGEEKNPGGASYMIRDGALENPRPASIIGQHVFPLLPTGKIGFPVPDRVAERSSGRGSDRIAERGSSLDLDRIAERGSHLDSDRGTDRSSGHDSERAAERASGFDPDRLAVRGTDRRTDGGDSCVDRGCGRCFPERAVDRRPCGAGDRGRQLVRARAGSSRGSVSRIGVGATGGLGGGGR